MTIIELITTLVMGGLVVFSAYAFGRGLDAHRVLRQNAKDLYAYLPDLLAQHGLPSATELSVGLLDQAALPVTEGLLRTGRLVQGAGYFFTITGLVIGNWSPTSDLSASLSVALLSTLIAIPCNELLSWYASRIDEELTSTTIDLVQELRAMAAEPDHAMRVVA